MEGEKIELLSVGPAVPQIIINDVSPFTTPVTFNLRNGDVTEARSLLVNATVAPVWHWRTIQGLPPEQALKNVDAYIKSAYVSLTSPLPTGWSVSQARKAAIVLGTARAVTTERYRITAQDLIPEESAEPHFVATELPIATWGLSVNSNLPQPAQRALTAPLNLSDQERAVIVAAHMSAIGILPVQGYSLIMTGHHYLREAKTQSRKAFDPIERQYWKSKSVSSWWQDDADLLRDALWHKACYPVALSIKKTLACDETTKEMLIAAGAGAAASRLPAVESEVRAANSYRTLLQTVRPHFESYGGSINFTALDDAIAAVKLFPIIAAQNAPSLVLPPTVPTYVNSRNIALQYLRSILSRNTNTVAYCYGFYCALLDQTETLGAGATTDTLKFSYSLNKLKSQCYVSFVAGQQAHGDYTAARGHTRAKGD